MLKNCVFKASVDTVEWCIAAGKRAIKTMAQTALSMMVVGAAITEMDWAYIGSVALGAGVASVLMSIVGIKEVPAKEAN